MTKEFFGEDDGFYVDVGSYEDGKRKPGGIFVRYNSALDDTQELFNFVEVCSISEQQECFKVKVDLTEAIAEEVNGHTLSTNGKVERELKPHMDELKKELLAAIAQIDSIEYEEE